MIKNITYLALLRGVNVGGNRKIEMVKLKRTFELLGFSDVKTFIASGNVIFHTTEKDISKLASIIESAIKKDFGISTKVLVRDFESMEKLVKAIPDSCVNNDDIKCDVMFLWKEIDHKKILKQLPYNSSIEDLKYIPGAVIWRIDRKNTSKSRMFKIVGTKLHQYLTVRNPNTVRKLYELMLK